MTPESRKFRFSSWTFLDKRFVELDAEKAEFSENRGFVALHCFALQKQTFLAQKVIFNQNSWFLKIFLARNVMKIIFRTFLGAHGVFNYRIKE